MNVEIEPGEPLMRERLVWEGRYFPDPNNLRRVGIMASLVNYQTFFLVYQSQCDALMKFGHTLPQSSRIQGTVDRKERYRMFWGETSATVMTGQRSRPWAIAGELPSIGLPIWRYSC